MFDAMHSSGACPKKRRSNNVEINKKIYSAASVYRICQLVQ